MQLLECQQTQTTADGALCERTRIIALTADVGLALNRSEKLQDMLQCCAQAMVDNLDAAFARIWTLNAYQNMLELQASAGIYTNLDGTHARIPVGAFKIGLIAQERTPHLTNDVLTDPRISNLEWARREGMVSFAGYPLLVEDRLVGVMAMFSRRSLGQMTLDAMATVANQIAVGIERKQAEERLRFAQFTIAHIATPVMWIDDAGRIFSVNEAACRLSGYTNDALMTATVFDLNLGAPLARWVDIWSKLRHNGAFSMEAELRRSDGNKVPVNLNLNFLELNGQECTCAILQDITERKQVEEAQRQSDLRFRTIYNHLQLQIKRMPLAYVLFDQDCRISDWNPAAERIFGYSKEEVLGLGFPYDKVLSADYTSHVDEILRRLKSGDMSSHSTNENLTKDGRIIVCEWINTPLYSDDGRFAGLMSLVQDVTERKRMEERFRQSQKMEAVGKLAGGVAHDFNNLLTLILGYSEVLGDSLGHDSPLRELVREIHRAGTRAAELTRQLLAFGRKQMLIPIVLDLNVLLADMEKMLRRVVGEDLNLTFSPAENLWKVRVDAGQIEQVVMNLVINSRDAMPQGGRLTIETANVTFDPQYASMHTEVEAGDYVLLAVTDTGCGMDKATMARMFEPFFTTKGDQGTGLGLATVYGIIKQSGGHISVYSESGCGTSIKIYLPRDGNSGSVAIPYTQTDQQRHGGETVLLVEDEDGVRNLARVALQHFGYNVLTARHGLEALAIAEHYAGSIDLLATDIVMPNMSGHELAQHFKPLRPNMKVLYMSGYMDEAVVRHGWLEAGAPFLQKPYTPDILAQKVRAVLDR